MNRGRIALAAILVLFGLLFLLDNLEIIDVGGIWSNLWPLLLVLLGIWWLASGGGFLAVVLLVIGLALLAERLALIPEGAISRYWPALLILGGGWLLFRGVRPSRPRPISRRGSFLGNPFLRNLLLSFIFRKVFRL